MQVLQSLEARNHDWRYPKTSPLIHSHLCLGCFHLAARTIFFAALTEVYSSLFYASHPEPCSNDLLRSLSSSTFPPNNKTFFISVLRASLESSTAQRGILPGQLVHLFVGASEETVLEIVVTLSNAVTSCETSLRTSYTGTTCSRTKSSI